MKPITLHPDADDEIAEAVRYYESRDPGLGLDLLGEVEQAILTGGLRRTWPRDAKYELVGSALDGRPIGVVCRITMSGKVRVITVYEDRPGR